MRYQQVKGLRSHLNMHHNSHNEVLKNICLCMMTSSNRFRSLIVDYNDGLNHRPRLCQKLGCFSTNSMILLEYS